MPSLSLASLRNAAAIWAGDDDDNDNDGDNDHRQRNDGGGRRRMGGYVVAGRVLGNVGAWMEAPAFIMRSESLSEC